MPNGRSLALVLALLATTPGVAARDREPQILPVEGDVSPIHDPAVIRQGRRYHVFATNRFAEKLVPMFCSDDLRRWSLCGNVFDAVPEWAQQAVPGTRGIWAPDISFFAGRYHLYYSVSTFGKNRSVIGLATNATLDPSSPDYRWTDEGLVVGSTPEDDWNAIDPNLAFDEHGDAWLCWGSFWGGIKLRRVDATTGKLSQADTTLYALASRRPLQPPAIEAPFIVRRGKHYYLFVSFDLCCKGKDSTYKVVVGRAPRITGPYVDRDGTPMMQGGGTLVVEGGGAWHGAGHQAVLADKGGDLLFFHAYDATTGRPRLQISTLAWEHGWPRAGVLK